jgi:hypothetical protein
MTLKKQEGWESFVLFCLLSCTGTIYKKIMHQWVWSDQCYGSGSISESGLDPDSMGPWIRIRIWIRNKDPDLVPGGQKCPTNKIKGNKFHFFEVLDVVF